MDSNQSEQQFYLPKLSSNIISPAQYPCNVIGSNKNNIHTIVPSISNSPLNINVKYQNSNDSKLAQNISYNCYSNIANSSFNVNQNEEIKFLFSGTKPKKVHNKRVKTVNQCVNKDNDNSSDITAAPNQLTILVQEVLPAQVPDHHPLSSAQSRPVAISSPREAAVLSPLAVLPTSINVDTIASVINDVLVKAMSNEAHDDVFLSVLKSRCDPSSPDSKSSQYVNFVDEPITSNKRRNQTTTAAISKTVSKRPKLSEPIYNEHKPSSYQRCQLTAPNFRKLVHEPRVTDKCAVLPPLGFINRSVPCIDLSQLTDNCVKYKRVPFSLSRPRPDPNSLQDSFIVQNLNGNIPSGSLLASRDSLSGSRDQCSDDFVDYIVAPSPNNNDLDYLSVFSIDYQTSSPTVNLIGPNLEMLHRPIRTQSPQLSLFHCPNKDYLTRDTLSRSRKCVSTPPSDTSVVDSETGELVIKTKTRPDDSDYFLAGDKGELPLYSEKVYKSTSLLATDLNNETLVGEGSGDHRIFIGESPSETAIVVQGSLSKSKQICKRLNLVLNDKITKKKTLVKCASRQYKGIKYHSHNSSEVVASGVTSDLVSNIDQLVISESQFVNLSRQSNTVRRKPSILDTRLCSFCHRPGDSPPLLFETIDRWMHVTCARENNYLLLTSDNERRVCFARDESSQIVAAINDVGEHASHSCVRIGALTVLAIGQLLPHQIQSGHFHTLAHVYPIGFKSRRHHWSSRLANTRAIYHCKISLVDDRPLFTVIATDDGLADLIYQARDCSETWREIVANIARLRNETGLVRYLPQHIKGEDLFGLTEPNIVRAIESLPGLESLHDYAFKYGKMELYREMPLPVTLTGSVRTEQWSRAVRHSPVFARYKASGASIAASVASIAASVASQSASGIGTVASKWQQYRRLKHDWKHNVILKRSRIQGLGLYAARDLDKGTMIIEYIGELIRNEVANRREKQYEARQQGVYMFRLDDSTVIDATRAGDLARYINHCCEPNCVTEVVDCDKERHIVISSSRRIEKNEELNYDYKFDLDDVDNDEKIACLCGAKNCRRWMN